MSRKPDLAFLDGSQVRKLCEEGVNSTNVPIDIIAHQCELICAYFMSLIANETFQATTGLQVHLQRYLEWTRHHFEFFKLETFLASDPDGHRMIHDNTYRENFMNDCAQSSQEGELCVTVGKKLRNILLGELDPLDLLFTAQLAQNFYSSPALTITYGRITTYIDLLAHKNPSLKILEIGAGTGAATQQILRCLDSGKVRRPRNSFFSAYPKSSLETYSGTCSVPGKPVAEANEPKTVKSSLYKKSHNAPRRLLRE